MVNRALTVLLVADASIAVFNAGAPSGWITGAFPALTVIGPAIAYLLLYYALAKSVASVPQFASGMVGSLLANIGDGAAQGVIGAMGKPVDIAVGAAKGAATGVAGGPAGIKAGAAKGAVHATMN